MFRLIDAQQHSSGSLRPPLCPAVHIFIKRPPAQKTPSQTFHRGFALTHPCSLNFSSPGEIITALVCKSRFQSRADWLTQAHKRTFLIADLPEGP